MTHASNTNDQHAILLSILSVVVSIFMHVPSTEISQDRAGPPQHGKNQNEKSSRVTATWFLQGKPGTIINTRGE